MVAKVILFGYKSGEVSNFLSKFYNSDIDENTSSSWQKEFYNPVEISELVAAFVDNNNYYDFTMWVSLDEDVFIKISPSNANNVIKYLFERYPY